MNNTESIPKVFFIVSAYHFFFFFFFSLEQKKVYCTAMQGYGQLIL